MVILNGAQLQARIFEKMKSAPAMDFAVAFWGTGSIEALGLSKLRTGRIICNLTMGGTNPKVIRDLKSLGLEVRHLDTLHSKIYLFDDIAFVGSSNASANGLSFEGRALSGWHETNVAISDASQIADLRTTFQSILRDSKDVDESDLAAAEYLFNKRRSLTRPTNNFRSIDLFDVFNSTPALEWRSSDIYVCGYSEPISTKAESIVKKAKAHHKNEDNVDGFEGWGDDIAGTTLVCFDITLPSKVVFDGIWKPRSEPSEESSDVYIADKLKNGRSIPFFDEKKLQLWEKAVLAVLKAGGRNHFLMEIGEFFDKFVKPTT